MQAITIREDQMERMARLGEQMFAYPEDVLDRLLEAAEALQRITGGDSLNAALTMAAWGNWERDEYEL